MDRFDAGCWSCRNSASIKFILNWNFLSFWEYKVFLMLFHNTDFLLYDIFKKCYFKSNINEGSFVYSPWEWIDLSQKYLKYVFWYFHSSWAIRIIIVILRNDIKICEIQKRWWKAQEYMKKSDRRGWERNLKCHYLRFLQALVQKKRLRSDLKDFFELVRIFTIHS